LLCIERDRVAEEEQRPSQHPERIEGRRVEPNVSDAESQEPMAAPRRRKTGTSGKPLHSITPERRHATRCADTKTKGVDAF
jgi:hypothetical protein